MKFRLFIITLLFQFFFHTSVYAIFPVGTEITYKCLDASGNYKVTLVIYRSCQGVPICGGNCSTIGNCSYAIDVRNGDASNFGKRFFSINLFGTSVRDYSPNPRCPDAKSTCDVMGCVTPGTAPGVERYEFSGIVNIGPSAGSIPSTCCNVLFSFKMGERITLDNIIPNNIYAEAVVNRCSNTYPKCNAPEFRNDFPLGVCINQPLIFNIGASDPDLDSLSYELVPSKEDTATNSTYNIPYTYNLPVPYTAPSGGNFPSGFSLEPETGDIKFKPNLAPFTGVIAVKIIEWRKLNGQYQQVGYVRKDLILYLKSCASNSPPSFRSAIVRGGIKRNDTYYEACSGNQVCFNVTAHDMDSSLYTHIDTTYMTWDSNLSIYGATFLPLYNAATRKSNGPRQDSFQICWMPHDSMVRTLPYTFTIKAIDDRCPYPGIRTQQFRIKVSAGAKTSINKTVNCGTGILGHTFIPEPYYNTQWALSQTPEVFDSSNVYTSGKETCIYNFAKAGNYPLTLSMTHTGCGITYVVMDTVYIPKTLRINSDTTFCNPPLNITFNIRQPASVFNLYRWYSLPDTLTVIDTTEQLSLPVTGNMAIVLRTQDTSETCLYSDTSYVKAARLKAGIIKDAASLQCYNHNIMVYRNTSTDSLNNPLQFSWQFSDGFASTQKTLVSHSLSTPGKFHARITAYTAFGCSDTSGENFEIYPSPKALFNLASDSVQCFYENMYRFENHSQPLNDTLQSVWVTDHSDSLLSRDLTKQFHNPGSHFIHLRVTTNHACADTASSGILVNPSPGADFTVSDPVACAYKEILFFNYSTISKGTLSYQWKTGDGFTSTDKDLLHAYARSGLYSVTLVAISDKDCKDTITKSVQIMRPEKPVISGDTIAPRSSNRTYTTTNHPGSHYTWSVMSDATNTLYEFPLITNSINIYWGNRDTGYIWVTEKSSFDCVSDTGFLLIRLDKPDGLNDFNTDDKLVLYPQPVSDFLYISGMTAMVKEIQVFSGEGKFIYAFDIEEIKSGKLNTSALENGIYFMRISDSSGQSASKKLIVVK